MHLPLLPIDTDFTTAPIIMTYPASPHLAARIDKREIDLSLIDKSTNKLFADYDTILMEGAGGIMVPITENYLTIDYIHEKKLPLAIVTNGQLGSINHTLLTIEAAHSRGIDISYLIYNPYFDEDATIAAETQAYFSQLMKHRFPDIQYIIMNNEHNK